MTKEYHFYFGNSLVSPRICFRGSSFFLFGNSSNIGVTAVTFGKSSGGANYSHGSDDFS